MKTKRQTLVRAYGRCPQGDYVVAGLECCPIDGRALPESKVMGEIVRRLEDEGSTLTTGALVSKGLSTSGLSTTIVIQFGSEASAFDAISIQDVCPLEHGEELQPAHVYSRCNGGDYYLAELAYCPLDGWASPETKAIAQITRRLQRQAIRPAIDELMKAGLGSRALERAIVIEFGSAQDIFEAISPKGYVVDGHWSLLRNLGPKFK